MMAPETSRLQIVERQVNDVTILHLTGEITLDDGDLAYGRAINQLMENNQTRILVDLSEVTRIDSSGIGMMAAKVKVVRGKGGDVRLMRLTRRTQHLVGMLKLTMVFETFDDEAVALQSFARRPGV
jgi:anti-sigma B factor antagonist